MARDHFYSDLSADSDDSKGFENGSSNAHSPKSSISKDDYQGRNLHAAAKHLVPSAVANSSDDSFVSH